MRSGDRLQKREELLRCQSRIFYDALQGRKLGRLVAGDDGPPSAGVLENDVTARLPLDDEASMVERPFLSALESGSTSSRVWAVEVRENLYQRLVGTFQPRAKRSRKEAQASSLGHLHEGCAGL